MTSTSGRVKRVVLIHGYSAKNLGDGLLVRESVGLIKAALGADVDITVVASRPESFVETGMRVISSKPRSLAQVREYVGLLRSFGSYDLVAGVGGGYLRGGRPRELLTMLLAHGPQLLAAAATSTPSVYFPQSIGPLRFGSRTVLRPALRRVGPVLLRDDRSIEELGLPNAQRWPDLAILQPGAKGRRSGDFDETQRPVVTVRAVGGEVPEPVLRLVDGLRPVDGFVQSATGGNDDRPAMTVVAPDTLLDASEVFDSATRRVVLAVRLHAALMSIAAGHYVVHLAYERKGFGAFADLGLEQYVHNVNDFDRARVLEQVESLRVDAAVRRQYDAAVDHAYGEGRTTRQDLIGLISREVESALRVQRSM